MSGSNALKSENKGLGPPKVAEGLLLKTKNLFSCGASLGKEGPGRQRGAPSGEGGVYPAGPRKRDVGFRRKSRGAPDLRFFRIYIQSLTLFY